ncbi:MAG: hypothetical protein RIQ91_810, partial [Bacteroidota bacterium]
MFLKITTRSHTALSILLFFVSMYIPLHAQNGQGQEGAAGLSSAFYGHYKGTLNIYKSANEVGMTATMEIIFGPPITTPPTEKNLNPQLRYPFIIKYDNDIRRYDLVADAN